VPFSDAANAREILDDLRHTLTGILPKGTHLTHREVSIDLSRTRPPSCFRVRQTMRRGRPLILLSSCNPTGRPPTHMDLTSLSNTELADALRALKPRTREEAAEAVHQLHDVVHELQVHRVELEMQNRALREMQCELEHSVARHADLYEHLPVAYVTVTPQARVVESNRRAAELLGPERGSLVGNYLRNFLGPYDAGRLAAHLEACTETGHASTLELSLRLRDGSSLAVQLSSRPGEGPDGERLVHIAITDISKLKHTQRVLEEINREQEAFNYSISHDLRAPLVTISNYAKIISSEHAQALDEEAKAMLQRVEHAALRMEETLKQLLEYSSLAREEIRTETVNVDEVVHDLLIEHRGVIQERNAAIAVDRPLPLARGSRLILSQVLANLLTNALKYTLPGESPRVRFAGEVNDVAVIIKVADQGIGIDAKHHERIFRVFERLHGYSRYPGSGVGLAIARRAVERMNGRIWVESEPGKGSCFYIELPKP
jgi:PAS domain S-box-containing protein